ncbi:MAG: XrtA system polysaccharide deacetylase [Gammaproteobacteria bacterium]
MSVDVEDYFQVSAFEKTISRNDWDNWELRVERSTHRVMDIFDEAGIKSTFFMLGWVAERCPGLIERIIKDGHELASHGYEHTRVINQNREQFAADIRKTKALLEDMSGVAVTGYRAASYSIGRDNLWALDELQEAGHNYSSSLYPIKHDLYGMPEAPRFAFLTGSDGLLEIPVTTTTIAGRNMPCGGGGYFRLLPYPVYKRMLQRVNTSEKQPGVFYFHPWEIDPDQPRPPGASAKTRFRHYLNLNKMEARLRRLVNDFQWDRMDNVFAPAKKAA